MDSSSINRAVLSAGLWVALSLAITSVTGVNASMTDFAVDGVIMGASALASDVLHDATNMMSSDLSSAVVTGAIYTAVQKGYRGSDSYMMNFAVSAGNDWAVSTLASGMA